MIINILLSTSFNSIVCVLCNHVLYNSIYFLLNRVPCSYMLRYVCIYYLYCYNINNDQIYAASTTLAMTGFKVFYPNAWEDQRKPLGDN